jgi:hypothetical protein
VTNKIFYLKKDKNVKPAKSSFVFRLEESAFAKVLPEEGSVGHEYLHPKFPRRM